MSQFSENLKARFLKPHFKEGLTDCQKFLAEGRSGAFSFSFKEKDLETTIFGLKDLNDVPVRISTFKYSTELSEERLGVLDALVELLQGADYRRIESISLREVENFLRDENNQPAFPGEGAIYFPLLAKLKEGLNATLESDQVPVNGQKASPILSKDYKKSEPRLLQGNFLELDSKEKMLLVSQILEQIIGPSLYRDGGAAYPVFVDDYMVAIEYQGACASCNYSLTTTMDFIQKVLQLETGNPGLRVMTDS
ncbi:MAG: hypothetical protein HN509_18235 [Halobacteriovoraceae bacterium]|jgi:Fe-S cluster biogenesis protein NfuA|nr:hypothetical protein [Halobacteriovoraceae bacterium]MBT5095366.1 hypothetical protein [Halobacteriovoraceae bacterium]